ncbi:hypothetical protein CLAIMM_14981 [Cladophialophora immunda]|nr:hypothetical protein CLAIMM_14981 [Cladophialophora immunda]
MLTPSLLLASFGVAAAWATADTTVTVKETRTITFCPYPTGLPVCDEADQDWANLDDPNAGPSAGGWAGWQADPSGPNVSGWNAATATGLPKNPGGVWADWKNTTVTVTATPTLAPVSSTATLDPIADSLTTSKSTTSQTASSLGVILAAADPISTSSTTSKQNLFNGSTTFSVAYPGSTTSATTSSSSSLAILVDGDFVVTSTHTTSTTSGSFTTAASSTTVLLDDPLSFTTSAASVSSSTTSASSTTVTAVTTDTAPSQVSGDGSFLLALSPVVGSKLRRQSTTSYLGFSGTVAIAVTDINDAWALVFDDLTQVLGFSGQFGYMGFDSDTLTEPVRKTSADGTYNPAVYVGWNVDTTTGVVDFGSAQFCISANATLFAFWDLIIPDECTPVELVNTNINAVLPSTTSSLTSTTSSSSASSTLTTTTSDSLFGDEATTSTSSTSSSATSTTSTTSSDPVTTTLTLGILDVDSSSTTVTTTSSSFSTSADPTTTSVSTSTSVDPVILADVTTSSFSTLTTSSSSATTTSSIADPVVDIASTTTSGSTLSTTSSSTRALTTTSFEIHVEHNYNFCRPNLHNVVQTHKLHNDRLSPGSCGCCTRNYHLFGGRSLFDYFDAENYNFVEVGRSGGFYHHVVTFYNFLDVDESVGSRKCGSANYIFVSHIFISHIYFAIDKLDSQHHHNLGHCARFSGNCHDLDFDELAQEHNNQ